MLGESQWTDVAWKLKSGLDRLGKAMVDILPLGIPHEIKRLHSLLSVFADEVGCVELKIIYLWEVISLDFSKLTTLHRPSSL